MSLPVEVSDTEPNPKFAESSRANQRRTLWEWFRAMMKQGGHGRTPEQRPTEESPETHISIPHTKATPSNEQPSMMSPGQREKVSLLLFFPLKGMHI